MKKLFLWGTLIGLSGWIPAQAQAQKGTTYWGGTVSFEGNFQAEHETNNRNFPASDQKQQTFAPELQWGKFVNSTTLLGVGTTYAFSWGRGSQFTPNYSNRTRSTSHSIGLLPFIRKYKALGERWSIFLHGEIGPTYSWNRSKNDNLTQYDRENHQWRYGLSIKPGLVYFFPKKNLAIEGYANVLSFNAQYADFDQYGDGSFKISTGLSSNFPSYFILRIAKYIPTKTN
ncbi:hypothetical protein [Salmonirosea aquatica]|uniref:Outer membrane beta-barrel protein n=1 Tax=Salmonirosea aquatica TaxID=2654236 RepID=A0A7C9BFS4_9BACT|nr:hypothetical protein [Cytophagaceae bacterium SJW1-29]